MAWRSGAADRKIDLPDRVSFSGGKHIYDDISDTPDTQHALYDFAGFALVWEYQNSGGHGCEGREQRRAAQQAIHSLGCAERTCVR